MQKETQHKGRTRYGPTEATSGIQTHDLSDKTEEHIIGSPSLYQAYVLYVLCTVHCNITT